MPVLLTPTPYLDGLGSCAVSSQGGQGRWPMARCQVSWTRGRILPSVRCVLVQSDQYVTSAAAGRLGSMPAGASAAAGVPKPLWVNGWTRPLLSRTRTWAVALADTHKAWSNHSLQTLQRVGSMIRSTSLDCLAALGSKKGGAGAAAASQLPQHDQGSGPDGDDEDNSIVRASLSQFLSAASDAEVSHAARLADLSNMAYDVLDVTPERLQQAHGLTLVAHSRSSTASQQQQQKAQLPEQAAQQQHSLLLLQGRGVAEPQHTGLPQQPLPQGPWPVPVMLLQPSGISTQAAGGADWSSSSSSVGLPASPRTPAIMASYAEDDFVLGSAAAATAGEYQPVPAAGFYVDVGSPRRPSAAGNAAVATMARPAAPAMAGSPPAYGPVPQDDSSTSRLAGAGQHSADYYYSSSWPVAQYPQMLEQEYPQLSEEEEAALLQQLKQQEAWVLLEMQASQQMMMLLQQSQAASAPDGSPAQQELQLLQEVAAAAAASSSITAAASTAAAAALAGSSSSGAAEDFLPASSAAAAAGNPDAPADWFACDGPLSDSDATPTRFFAIQGSITLEHWRINLTIDPVEFEGGALGPIRVHRGMYEAALEMYDQILPHVQQHLAAHPQGKIALTGHSLGGSLATLLMLLMVHRGDLSVANVATVYTFGSPAVFCEGANGSPPTPGACQSCSLPCEHRKAAAATAAASSSATDSLLAKLELPADAVVNVIMTRDIVPRAFVCDYTLVAGVLKSWLPSFKEHRGLAACKDHKALYNFIGVVEVLQPTQDCDFVLPGEGHDMLPPGAALYKLSEPLHKQQPPAQAAGSNGGSSCGSQSRRGSFNSLTSLATISSMSLSSALAELTNSFSFGGSSSSGSSSGSSNGAAAAGAADSPLGMVTVAVEQHPEAGAAAAAEAAVNEPVSPFAAVLSQGPQSPAAPARPPAAAVAAAAADAAALAVVNGSSVSAVRKSPEGLTLGDAILTFMNSPHPLQTLGEMRAYGHHGSISRYHNPTSYTKALQHLSRQ